MVALLTLQPAVAFGQESTPAAGAQAEVLIIVRPSDKLDGERFEVTVEPGSSVSLTVMIGNAGQAPIDLRTYTSDIYTKVNGGLGLNVEGTEQHEPTTWMDYPTEVFSLQPMTEVPKDFTVSVPEGTAPGQYVIPIAVQTVDSVPISGMENFRQVIRKVIPVYVTVPGDLQAAFALGSPTIEYINGKPVIQVPIDNTGQLVIRLSGQFWFNDPAGTEIITFPVQLGAIYVGTSTVFEVPLNSLPPAGTYAVSLQLTDFDTGVSQSLDAVSMDVPEPVDVEQQPLSFSRVTIEPNAEPIQFASVAVDITNVSQVIRSARLTLSVSHNGEFVEDFIIADNFTLTQGLTSVQQRYLPATGWESGTYSFSLKLEAVEGESVTLLLSQDGVATIEVP